MNFITLTETKEIALEFGLTVKSASAGNSTECASITFTDGITDFTFDKTAAGSWVHEDFSKDENWGYMSSGIGLTNSVNLSYRQLLHSAAPHNSFDTVAEMLTRIITDLGCKLPASVHKVVKAVRPLGLGVSVGDIGFDGVDNRLIACFTVRSFDEAGNETVTHESEFIDLEVGLLVLNDTDSNMFHWSKLSSDMQREANSLVNKWLRANPIDDDFLQSFRDAVEEQEAA